MKSVTYWPTLSKFRGGPVKKITLYIKDFFNLRDKKTVYPPRHANRRVHPFVPLVASSRPMQVRWLDNCLQLSLFDNRLVKGPQISLDNSMIYFTMLDLVLIQLPQQRVLHCPQPPLKTCAPLLHRVAHYIAVEKWSLTTLLFRERVPFAKFSPDITSLEIGSTFPKARVCPHQRLRHLVEINIRNKLLHLDKTWTKNLFLLRLNQIHHLVGHPGGRSRVNHGREGPLPLLGGRVWSKRMFWTLGKEKTAAARWLSIC